MKKILKHYRITVREIVAVSGVNRTSITRYIDDNDSVSIMQAHSISKAIKELIAVREEMKKETSIILKEIIV